MAKCGLPCDIYSRITGYFRPTRLWNSGKQQEFEERKAYSLSKSTKPKKEV